MSKVKVSIGGTQPPKKSGKPSPIIIAGIALAVLILLPSVLVRILPGRQQPEEQSPQPALPAHTASQAPLGNAKRVEVDATDPALTRDDCVRLATYYAPYAAGGGGQVVVQKPNPSAPWNGRLMPFCVDNMDGSSMVWGDSFNP